MNAEQDPTTLKTHLKALDTGQLNHVLQEVLDELRNRESEQIKKDLRRYSQLLPVRKPAR